MSKPVTVLIQAALPEELLQTFLQAMRDFDTANPGCHFQIVTSTDQSNEEVEKILDSIDPGFAFRAIFRRTPP